MKRIILFATFIFSVLFSGTGSAQENIPCQGVSEITIVSTTPRKPVVVRRALANYDESRLSEGNYCLVFNVSEGAVPVIESDSDVAFLNAEELMRDHGNHDIYVVGLKLSAESTVTLPLLTITNNTTNRVIVTGLQMTNVKNGLKLMGTGPIEVRGSTITGSTDPALRTGQCVDVLSDGARVISSAVSNCARGIKIAASNVFLGAENPAAYETDKNTLSGNAIGIHQTSGTGNKWPFNSISGGGVLSNVWS